GVSGGEYANGVLHLTEAKQSFTFSGIASKPVLSLNRSFSAPIKLNFDQSHEDLVLIARHDSDMFARWQAINDLFIPALVAASAAVRAGQEPKIETSIVSALLEIVANDRLEPAFRAQVLNLVSEIDLAQEVGTNVDPDAIRIA